MEFLQVFLNWWWVIPIILVLVLYKQVMRLFGIILIPDDSIGVINKKFVFFGDNKTLPDGAIIAMNGEAGIQANTLAPGLHFFFWPWQFEIEIVKFVKVPVGQVGIVEARDGKPLSGGRVLARHVECDMFQDTKRFLQNSGERGIQINVVPPGTYRVNTSMFTVWFENALQIKDNMVGIVTTKEGKPLPTGEIAGRETPGHNMYQNGQAFVDNGGFKGLQEQVMLAGMYYINPNFISVEPVNMTSVPIAYAGVVIAYVGEEGKDVTGDSFKHGNLCDKGKKGVWVEPLDPGKYPINPYTHKVETVPTANVVLNWATGKTESHHLDEKLSTITVRSADGFTFNLDVSQIIHIPRTEAPKVIARFGTVANLVTQVLEPIIGNYFRNTAQSSDVIDFLKARSKRQAEAKDSIKAALDVYNVNAVDTLIGDINPPPELMKTLTDKKVAEFEKATFETQKEAQEKRQNLEQAKALAETQATVVNAERTVAIAEFGAKASIAKAEGDAKSKTINAKADAEVLTTVGKAEGEKITAVGSAEAKVIELKTNAMGQGNFAVVEVGRALAAAKIPLVPQIMAGSSSGQGGTLVDVLLANLIRDSLKKDEPVHKT